MVIQDKTGTWLHLSTHQNKLSQEQHTSRHKSCLILAVVHHIDFDQYRTAVWARPDWYQFDFRLQTAATPCAYDSLQIWWPSCCSSGICSYSPTTRRDDIEFISDPVSVLDTAFKPCMVGKRCLVAGKKEAVRLTGRDHHGGQSHCLKRRVLLFIDIVNVDVWSEFEIIEKLAVDILRWMYILYQIIERTLPAGRNVAYWLLTPLFITTIKAVMSWIKCRHHQI